MSLSVIHELVRSVMAADLLDEATKRIASAVDPTDTDEGMERVQTDLNAAILAAIEGVVAGSAFDSSGIMCLHTNRGGAALTTRLTARKR